MKKTIVVVAAMLCLVGSACGGSEGGTTGSSPEAALRRQVDYLTKGQTGRAYGELHPVQQAFISDALYQKCASQAGGMTVKSFKVKEIYDENITIPGSDVVVAAKAITAEIEIAQGLLKNKTTNTYHEILVDGTWRFTVSGGDEYRAGRCP